MAASAPRRAPTPTALGRRVELAALGTDRRTIRDLFGGFTAGAPAFASRRDAVMSSDTRVIQVDALARVEGEGRFKVRLDGDKVVSSEFSIFEPPRYFEGLLRGRSYRDAPDVTSRICGICPIAYIMGACKAMEDALGWQIPAADRRSAPADLLRRVDPEPCAAHPSAARAGFRRPAGLDRACAIEPRTGRKRAGRQEDRQPHHGGDRRAQRASGQHPGRRLLQGPVGGCGAGADARSWSVARRCPPPRSTLSPASTSTIWRPTICSSPCGTRPTTRSPRGASSPRTGWTSTCTRSPEHFEERQVPHSNALQGVTVDGRPYLVGPLARFNLNADRLPPDIVAMAERAGLVPGCRNPFKSLLARQVEVIYAFREAARLARAYTPPEPSFVEQPLRAGTGHGITEAPRGICYHRYEVAEDGAIIAANIVPPTSQNQRQIELDLVSTVERFHDLNDDALQWRCEQAIRNYDPCISCATHFLKLDVERT